jgi:hypothetical protein
MAALGADKTVWPSKLKKILKAGLVGEKSTIKLNLVLGKILFHVWPPFPV